MLRYCADAFVQAKHAKTGRGSAGHERAGQVKRIEGTNRFVRKRPAGAVHNLTGDPQQVPVRRSGIEHRPSIGRRGFRDLAGCLRPDEDAIALDQRQL